GHIRREVVAGQLAIVPVEHTLHVLARDSHALLGRTCLDHVCFLPVQLGNVTRDRAGRRQSIASGKSLVGYPSGMLSSCSCWAGNANESPLTGWSRRPATATAAPWLSMASPASARQRCWTTR